MTELPKIKLYTNEICPFAVRTHLALRTRNVPYEKVIVSFPLPESFKSKNPLGKIPTLEVLFPGASEPIYIYESAVTVFFIEDLENATGPSLMPSCAVKRAYVRLFMEHCSEFVSSIYKLLRASRATPEEIEALKTDLDNRTNFLEAFIQSHGSHEGPFIFGKQPSMADFHVAPFLDRLLAFFPHYRPYEPLTKAPRLRSICEAFANDANHQDIFLPKERYIELYQKYANPEN